MTSFNCCGMKGMSGKFDTFNNFSDIGLSVSYKSDKMLGISRWKIGV